MCVGIIVARTRYTSYLARRRREISGLLKFTERGFDWLRVIAPSKPMRESPFHESIYVYCRRSIGYCDEGFMFCLAFRGL